MMREGIVLFVAGFGLLTTAPSILIAEAGAAETSFQEVYDLIHSNLTGVSESDFNRTAVTGLVAAFNPKVILLTNDTSENPTVSGPIVTNATVYDRDIAYFRIIRIAEGCDSQFRNAFQKLGSTNKLKGMVIDLRYSDGDSYAAAAAVADLFVKKERPLLNWGEGVVRSKEKTDALTIPAAILVNGRTARAAEALAAALREVGAGLVLGTRTAGQAMVAREFTLSGGERLRIATSTVELGDGTVVAAHGLQPDIVVNVGAEEERAYYADAFKLIPKVALAETPTLSLTNTPNGTNRPTRRPRFNEAELVRERREGISRDADISSLRETELDAPVVHDPALARAIDLLKGLAVVRQSRF
jgi:hypothetical protein